MSEERAQEGSGRHLPEVLDELDVDEYEGLCERTGEVLLTINGKPRRVAYGTRDWEAARNSYVRKHPCPLPPYKEDLVSPDSFLGKRLDLSKPTMRRVYDEKDADYQVSREEWQDGVYYVIAAKALKLKLHASGKPIEDIEARAEALKKLGITPIEVAQISAMVARDSGLATAEAVAFSVAASGTQASTPGGSSPPAHGSTPKPLDSPEAGSVSS